MAAGMPVSLEAPGTFLLRARLVGPAVFFLPHLPVVSALFVGSVAGIFVAGLLAVLLTSSNGSLTGVPAGSSCRGRHLTHAITQPSMSHRSAPLDSPGRSVPPVAWRRSGAEPSSPLAIMTTASRICPAAPSTASIRADADIHGTRRSPGRAPPGGDVGQGTRLNTHMPLDTNGPHSEVQQPMRAAAVLDCHPHTRWPAPFNHEQDRASSYGSEGRGNS